MLKERTRATCHGFSFTFGTVPSVAFPHVVYL